MNEINSYLLLMMAVLCNVTGQFFSKKASYLLHTWRDAFNMYIFVSLIFYGLSTTCYVISLRRLPLSTAYPLFSITYILIFLLGHYYFGEVIDMYKIMGMFLIIAGVILFAASAGKVS